MEKDNFYQTPMAKRVAINGFGRIGRLVYRSLLETNFLNGAVEVVAVNDLVAADNLAYLLKYDTVHGKLDEEVKAVGEDTIQVGSNTFKTLALKVSPSELPWKDLNVDIVLECTGFFTKKVDAEGHIAAGAKKVIISAPSDAEVKTFLVGVNEGTYAGEDVISNASCTTNCIGPLAFILQKEGIGIEEGLMATNHAYTASQTITDGPSRKAFRDGRAGAQNIIPASTGAAKATCQVIPELKGKLTGMSFRVPVVDVSVVDLTFRTERETSLEEINAAMKRASETYLKGIWNYTEDEVVSSDFIHDSHSGTYDAKASMQLNPRFFKLIAWYDNEWGYSCRLADLLKVVVEKM
jgi:glyceraldehyde 3-phosphate dehydrogenase